MLPIPRRGRLLITVRHTEPCPSHPGWFEITPLIDLLRIQYLETLPTIQPPIFQRKPATPSTKALGLDSTTIPRIRPDEGRRALEVTTRQKGRKFFPVAHNCIFCMLTP